MPQSSPPGVASREPDRNIGRYIVRASREDDALARFLAALDTEPGVRLVDTIGPSAGPPHTAVVETDAATAERLRRSSLYQLTIEPDQPLSLSS
ncbi:hypothetical protein [Massilia sp.]|uniref:hypothetical protein n=1 Tax=Massilia sp. TaxID=1882437 RepID=UPI00289ECED1|nr:hypothetical protein [Massilia sp.]